jgi:hypothetical protein
VAMSSHGSGKIDPMHEASAEQSAKGIRIIG